MSAAARLGLLLLALVVSTARGQTCKSIYDNSNYQAAISNAQYQTFLDLCVQGPELRDAQPALYSNNFPVGPELPCAPVPRALWRR